MDLIIGQRVTVVDDVGAVVMFGEIYEYHRFEGTYTVVDVRGKMLSVPPERIIP